MSNTPNYNFQNIDILSDSSSAYEQIVTEMITKINNNNFAIDKEIANTMPHFDHVQQKYLNMDKYWDALRDGKIYTTEFNQSSVSPNPMGVKKDDNAEKVCEPSTNTIKGRNDYENIGLFKSIVCNGYVNSNDDYCITAIKGDGRFKKDGTMGDVWVMGMTGYLKYYETDTVWGVSYSDVMHPGFEILPEAEKPDGTIRPFVLRAKYVEFILNLLICRIMGK